MKLAEKKQVRNMKIIEHTVKGGESLLGISIIYGTNLRSLLQINNLTGEDTVLMDGDIVKVQVRENFTSS
jgi:LysM repeat protein